MLVDYSDVVGLYQQAPGIGQVGCGDHPGVLVIDFSYGFTSPESPVGTDMTQAVVATRRLLDAARGGGLPIWYTTAAYRRDLADAGVWPKKLPTQCHLTEGSRWVEIDDRLGRRESEIVIIKKYPSAFFGTPLQSMLVGAGVDTLVVTGCTTSCCVRTTVVDGMQYGYRVLVPRECVADRHPAPHEANLFEMNLKFADVLTLDAVIDLIAAKRAAPARAQTA